MLPSPNEAKPIGKPRSKPKDHVRPKNTQGYQYDLTGNASDCVQRYLDLSGVKRDKLKPVATPCLDDSQIPMNDHEIQGSLHAECSKIVLKFLWIARLTRPDIFWTNLVFFLLSLLWDGLDQLLCSYCPRKLPKKP